MAGALAAGRKASVAVLCLLVGFLIWQPANGAAAPSSDTRSQIRTDVRDRTFAPILGQVRAPELGALPLHTEHPASSPHHGHPGQKGGNATASTLTISFDESEARVAVRKAVPYRTPTGNNVWVSVSARYSQDPVADRTLVQYLDSLLHGDELAGLRLMVLRGDEIGRKCGVGTAACYFPASNTIVVVGEDRYGGLPTDYVLAHEYGHRIAQYRFNPPFRGGAFWNGPKRWATTEGVCMKLRRGLLSLGRRAYWNFPGENFAEAYARMHMRSRVRWQFAPSLKPDAAAYAAIRRDVKTPWMGSRVRDLRVTLRPGEVASYLVRTPLDGRFTADLYSLDGNRFGFELRRGKKKLTEAPRPTRDFRLSRLICGDRKLRVTVRAGATGGRFRLVIAHP